MASIESYVPGIKMSNCYPVSFLYWPLKRVDSICLCLYKYIRAVVEGGSIQITNAKAEAIDSRIALIGKMVL